MLTGWLAGVAAILPATWPYVPAQAAPTQPAALFAPPQTNMVLTRTVRRALSGNRELVVRRSYQVRIVPDGQGYRVEGALTGCTVEAPGSLQALAEIERKRPDTAMFPITLDGNGMIRSGSATGPGESLDRAADVASERLDAMRLSPRDLDQARAFVRQVQARAVGSQWPADLFHPAPGQRVERRSIPLPGGGTGSVTIEIAVRGTQEGGLLASLERVVITELDGDRRVTREEWTLAGAT